MSSIFKGFFNREQSGESLNSFSWNAITSVEQLNQIENHSNLPEVKAVVIFKHSTSCGISAMAKRRFEKEWKLDSQEVPVYLLDLIKFRNISNQIASIWNIWHESPQVIVLKDKVVIHNASHGAISAEKIQSII